MIFIKLGFESFKENIQGTETSLCINCHQEVALIGTIEKTYLFLFFFPIFKLANSYSSKCPACHYELPIDTKKEFNERINPPH